METYQSWVEREKRRFLDALSQAVGTRFHLEGRRESRWARSAWGTIAILASQPHEPGPHWWFGLKADEFRRRGGLGVIFLCQTEEGVLDFGVPASNLERVLPLVSREGRTGEHKLRIVRQDGGYLLRPDLDLKLFRGNVSWLRSEPATSPGYGDAPQPAAVTSAPSVDDEVAFFAKVQAKMLEPLDPVGLPDGEVVLVRATVVKSVPGSAALRRIVARGGPRGLPTDLAERHDYYRREGER